MSELSDLTHERDHLRRQVRQYQDTLQEIAARSAREGATAMPLGTIPQWLIFVVLLAYVIHVW